MFPGLPKWPALTVIGKPVTKEQAAQIIIRTQQFYFSTNDHTFKEQLEKVLGLPEDRYDHKYYEILESKIQEYKCLPIEYLTNSQIVSSYIGGPHGWCNWSGRIYCDSYNIGKWPGCDEVLNEWKLIAEAFPFLELKSQLWSGEQCAEDKDPVIQFNVAKGKVEVVDCETLIYPVSEVAHQMLNLFRGGRERGCTLAQFKEALEICKK